jgi:predicted transcriptional regulator
MRTIVDLPDSQISELSILERTRNTSRAQLIREAIARYLKAEIAPDDAGFGAWQRAGAQQDGLAAQQAMRAEWDR